MAKKFPIFPKNPDRICWGCDKYCAATDLQCGNGSERIQHPFELDGPDWYRQGDWRNLLSDAQQIELGHPCLRPERLPNRPNRISGCLCANAHGMVLSIHLTPIEKIS